MSWFRLPPVPAASTLLNALERIRLTYGRGMAEERLALLEGLEDARLRSAAQVRRLHEALCLIRAFPDSREVLRRAEAMLESFAKREELEQHRDELVDSGIAGTDIYYRFYWVTARWLAKHWPDRLTVDWEDFEDGDRVVALLDLLLPFSETLALDMVERTPREWLESLKRSDETDAAFLIRRFDQLDASEAVRERMYEQLDVPIHLAPGADTPSRTRARHPAPRVVTQRRPLVDKRPDLRQLVPRLRPSTRTVWLQEAQALIGRAREAMVTRSRDLDGFAQADENDVRMVRFSGGLELALCGAQPRHRLLLESRYALLLLKNGVPIGYALINSLFGSSEIALNIFETFRGAETAQVFARVLSVAGRHFGADTYAIDPYQLGYGNDEGLRSGAWWFYYKLGFRPHDPSVKRLVTAELSKMRSRPGHRSTRSTLERLASEYMFLYLCRPRPRRDVLGRIDLGIIGERVSGYLAERFGADRERGVRTCAREVYELLETPSGELAPTEREAWERWAPLVKILSGVEGWSKRERSALAGVVRAKGGKRESDYVARFDRHAKLRRAILELAEPA